LGTACLCIFVIMRISVIVCFITLFVITSQPYYAQQVKDTSYRAGYVYASNITYLLNTPKNWVFDNTSGIAQNIPVVMYPKQETYEKTPVLIYSNIIPIGKKQSFRNIKQILVYDSAQHKKSSPASIVKKMPEVIVSRMQKTKALVWYYEDGGTNFIKQLSAYIEVGKQVVIISFQANTQPLYDAHKEDFYETIASFVLMNRNQSRK
jgi:hypothetical protein